jgi:hypothetical protein
MRADHNVSLEGRDCTGSQCVTAGVQGWSRPGAVPEDHWCAECEGRGWLYVLDGWSLAEMVLAVAQAITDLADDNTFPAELDEEMRNVGESLRLWRDDEAVARLEQATEDAIWRAGCG